MHVSIDIETRDLKSTAVVMSVGMCLFDKTSVHKSGLGAFHITLDDAEQIELGRTTSLETDAWWSEQRRDVRDTTFMRMYTPTDALLMITDRLTMWADQHNIEGIWCKGPHFDAATLLSLADTFGVDLGIHHRLWRDVRTAKEIIADDPSIPPIPERIEHHALEDAIYQAYEVRRACLSRDLAIKNAGIDKSFNGTAFKEGVERLREAVMKSNGVATGRMTSDKPNSESVNGREYAGFEGVGFVNLG